MDQSARRARQVFKIPSYLGVHKSELERKMKTRRDRVATQQETFRDYSAYINKESVAGYLDQKWSIPPSARPQLNAKAVHFRQVKNQVLSRRAELTEKLRREETEQVAELKAIKDSSRNGDLEALTRRVEEIKREKETARREVAQARKYQMWKRDNSRLRSAEGYLFIIIVLCTARQARAPRSVPVGRYWHKTDGGVCSDVTHKVECRVGHHGLS